MYALAQLEYGQRGPQAHSEQRHKRTNTMTTTLPSLDKEAVVVKQLAGQRLGKVVCKLKARFNFVNFEFISVRPKPVPLVEKVASAIGDAMIGGQVVSTLVVLKDSGPDRGSDRWRDAKD